MSGMLWCFLNRTKPVRCPHRRSEFWHLFQELWVSSTLAAFIVAFAANLPAFLSSKLRGTPNAIGVLSYLYLTWLMWYFFVSWFNMEQHVKRSESRDKDQRKEIVFQVIQSFASLLAAFSVGFLGGPPAWAHGYGYLFAQGAICLICIMSRVMFHNPAAPGKNRLRAWGGVVAAAPILLWLVRPGWAVHVVSDVCLGFLCVFLLAYTLICYDEDDHETAV